MLFFFYGTLRSEARLRTVLGRAGAAVRPEPAVLEGFEARYAPGRPYPMAVRRRGAELPGILVEIPTRRMAARLNRHEGPEYRIARLPVRDGRGRERRAAVYVPCGRARASFKRWCFESWRDAGEKREPGLFRGAS